MSMSFTCSKCNQPVDQPCCRIEIANLKKDVEIVLPCLLTINKPSWKRTPKKMESPKPVRRSARTTSDNTTQASPVGEITPLCSNCIGNLYCMLKYGSVDCLSNFKPA